MQEKPLTSRYRLWRGGGQGSMLLYMLVPSNIGVYHHTVLAIVMYVSHDGVGLWPFLDS